MKKLGLFIGMAAFLAAGVFFVGCDKMGKDEFTMPNFSNGKNQVVLQTIDDWLTIDEIICAGEEHPYTFNYSGRRTVQIQQYSEEINDWIQIYQSANLGEHTAYLVFDEAGSYLLRLFISGPGGPSGQEFTIEVINCGCDEEFSYKENEDGTYTFTYVPDEDMEGAEVVFTFAQTVEVKLEGFDPSGATMQAEVDFTACEPVEWIVEFVELRCQGQGQSEVNAWTDFKVNDVSKKNDDTPNIVLPCTE